MRGHIIRWRTTIILPHQQKRIPYILIRLPLTHIHNSMYQLRNFIYKLHHILQKHLRSIRKIANITEPKNGINPNSIQQRIHITPFLQIRANNLAPSLPKSQSQKCSDLHNSLLQQNSFILRRVFRFNTGKLLSELFQG